MKNLWLDLFCLNYRGDENLSRRSVKNSSPHQRQNDEFGDILRIYFLCRDEVYLLREEI